MEPGGRQPAPGALALVQAFVNTNDIEAGRDALDSPERLRRWLARRGLLGDAEAVSEADLRRALAVREALRVLLLANGGAPLDADAVATLNRLARDAPLQVCFDGEGRAELAPAGSGVDGALARILAGVYTAMTEGAWARLKVCRNDACLWAFYDASKNRSGAWCTMAICGNRTKVRAYQQRRRSS